MSFAAGSVDTSCRCLGIGFVVDIDSLNGVNEEDSFFIKQIVLAGSVRIFFGILYGVFSFSSPC